VRRPPLRRWWPHAERVTSWHVLSGAAVATITMDTGATFDSATFLIGDENTDVAVIKVAGRDLPTLPIRSSIPAVGEKVVVIGVGSNDRTHVARFKWGAASGFGWSGVCGCSIDRSAGSTTELRRANSVGARESVNHCGGTTAGRSVSDGTKDPSSSEGGRAAFFPGHGSKGREGITRRSATCVTEASVVRTSDVRVSRRSWRGRYHVLDRHARH